MHMTKEQAVLFFAELFCGEHHIPKNLKPFGIGWHVAYIGDFSTFDGDLLTRLVFLAHDRCVRAEIVNAGPHRTGIAIWQRGGREGRMMERHPGLEEAVESWRKRNPIPSETPVPSVEAK